MAVPADRLVAVYVPVTVYEVIHVAVMPLTIYYDILKIKLSCFREQRVKLFRYIFLCSEMVRMQPFLKKRDDFLFCLFIRITCLWFHILIIITVLKLSFNILLLPDVIYC